MPAIIQLPQVGESVTEGIIGRWLVQPGDRVEKYDPLVEVTTDKVNMEVPAPYAGVILRTLVAEGDTVEMGKAIAELEIDGQPGAAVADAAATPAPAEPAADREAERRARVGEFLESVRSVGPTGSGEGGLGRPDADVDVASDAAPVRAARPGGEAGEALEVPTPKLDGADGEGRGLSPLVRRLVAQHGVDIAQVVGTGRGGRITKDDVQAHVESRDADSAHHEPLGSGPGEGRAASTTPSTNSVALTPLRRTIAEHMARAWREIPAAWSLVEADVSGLVACRAANKDSFLRDHGAPLTYLAFAAHATAQALRAHPRLNSRWEGDTIAENERVNLGIAVSTDAGLIVPVVHDADALSIAQLAVAIHALAEKARGGTLALADVQGGTFTLNNTGALGSIVSVPIVNHPQAAILTTEAIVKRPVVVEGDAIVVRSMMNLCMTFDHRVGDGADAGALMADVKARIEGIGQGTPLG